jgi:outer membrane receptor protein involved in Fe transport
MTAGTYTIDAIAPAIPAPGTGFDDAKQAARLRGSFAQPGLFATGTIRLGQRVTLLPGVRFTQRAVVFKRFSTEPRLRLAIEASPTTTVKAGVGMYVQSPDVFEFNEVWGNPRIGLERAVHSSVGVAQIFPSRNVTIELVGFHKYMYDLATLSRRLVADDAGNPRPETFANAGDAHVFGAELLVRRDLARNLFGWLSYTASRALYRERPGTPRYPFQFDQPHILTALLVYQLPRRWQIGARFRLVSGNPYTPIDDCVWDVSNATCIPLEGPTNSARLRTFHQLDLRLDKTWAFRLITLTAYLDLQNAYNRRNPEALLYSWDYHDSSVFAGLPILPSLGLRLNW